MNKTSDKKLQKSNKLPEVNSGVDSEKFQFFFPPKISQNEKWILRFNVAVAFLFLYYLLDQFCINKLPPNICFSYVALGFLIINVLIYRLVRHKITRHKLRLEDPSEVNSIFVEAGTIYKRVDNPERPKDFKNKLDDLKKEVIRLKQLGEWGWTEYQILSLNQMLVDFLKIEELKARALSSLEDLEEYADERYSIEHYTKWEERIKEAIEQISDKENDIEKKDDSAEALRAELKTLLEHVTDYDLYWSQGSAIVHDIKLFGIVTIPLLLAMGLLPVIHPINVDVTVLGIFNWGLLGIGGAITAVLLNLHKSNVVDVGTTKGKEVLSRVKLGAGLGLVAGILLYSMVAGGILDGAAFPNIPSDNVNEKFVDLARSIFWGIASGFSFEWVFDRLRSKMDDNN